MKQVFKHFLTITALLCVALGAAAQGDFSVIKKIEGVDVGNLASPGNVDYSNGTITVTPENGYYLTAEDITVYKMINGQYAQGRRREPSYNTQVAITATDPDADPSKATTYTFTKPGDEYDYEIVANFHVRKSVEDATVTGLEESYTYTGEAIKPVVTVKADDNTLTLGTDYRAFYADSINASTDQVKGKITLYGIRKYTGTKQINYTIAKADPTLTFSSATATYTFGQEFTKPTLTTTPAGLEVTYTSSNENVAKADEASGDITPVAASTEAITITASFAGNDNYNAEEATYALTVAKGTAVVTKVPTAKENLTYTGEAQALINVGECTTGNMQYKVGTDGTYSANIPSATDAQTYTVYYKDAGDNNYNASEESSITVTIGRKAGSISYATANVNKTFGDEPFTNELTITGDGTVSYSSLNEEVATVNATTGEVTIKTSGEATIKATVADKDGGNYTYETKTATYLLNIATKAMEVTATAYTGTYDGEAHTITVTAPEDATVKYGTTEGTYNLETCPTYTDAGNYTVFYQATKPNYTTVTGSQTVTISKAAGTISYAMASVNKTYGDEPFINELTITGDGVVSYSSLNENTATVNTTTGEVTIIASGEATIKATVTDKEGGNYTYENKTATYLLSVDTEAMEVSATAYTGTYDGEAHTITVTAPEDATVKYGATEGTYDLDACPTYTNAGTYTVFYQVSKPNFTTISGSQTVTISKAAGTISYATTTVNKIIGTDVSFINELTIVGDGKVAYTISEGNVATINASTGEVTIGEIGEATITATVTDGTNYTYATKTATYTLNVASDEMEVTATGYEGAYDGKAHGITVTVISPENATVLYGTREGQYDLEANPTYTNAGRYTVYYQVTKTGYLPVTGSEVISITPGTGSISFAEESVSKTVGDEPFTNTLTNTGDGAVTYESSDTNVATVDANGQVSIVGAGNTIITATVGDGNNYIYETKTATYTLTVEAQEEPEPQPQPVEPTLSWVDANQNPVDAVTVTFKGDYSALPTLSKTEGLEVTYNSTEASVATVDENGAVEIISAGTTTISAIFKGNDDYTEKTASYDLTVEEAQEPEPQPQPVEPTLSWVDASQNVVNAVTVIFGDDYSALPTLNKTEGLEVTYDSTDPNVASISETGAVNIHAEGTTTISAIFKGNDDYTQKTARYILTVNSAIADGYPLWVNGTQVTRNNWQDVLGHTNNPEIPFYIFNAEKKQLLIDHDQTRTTVIESRMPELNIYLLDVSKIDHIFFNNTGDDSNKGTLTFTTNGNFPGKLVLTNSTEGESAITGFSEINYKWNLVALEPDGVDYNTTKLQMEYKEKDEDGKETGNILVADNITIGQAIVPITEKKTIHFEETQLVEKDEDGHEILDEDGNPIPANLSNYAYAPSNTEKNVVLITLNPENIGEGAGGFGVEDGFSGIYIGDTMTDTKAGQVADDVNNQNMVPGGSTYAENYDGFTFMLPAGYGIVEIDDFVEDGYEFHLIIGTDDPIALDDSNSKISRFDATSQHVQAEIHFNVKEPVYCYLYLVRKTSGARSIVPIGRREKAHGKVVSISVKVSKAADTNPPSVASGGVLPLDEDPEVTIEDTDGVKEIIYTDRDRVGNDRWYNLNGQQIDTPTKKGFYIRNQKKIYVK